MLAVGADGVVGHFNSSVIPFSFSLSLGDSLI